MVWVVYDLGVSRQGQFNLRVAEGTLAEWRVESARRGVRLSVLVREAMDLMLGSATGEQASSSAVVVTTPLPVPVPKVEPAPKSVEPPRQPKRMPGDWKEPVRVAPARRRHGARCDCAMCRL